MIYRVGTSIVTPKLYTMCDRFRVSNTWKIRKKGNQIDSGRVSKSAELTTIVLSITEIDLEKKKKKKKKKENIQSGVLHLSQA